MTGQRQIFGHPAGLYVLFATEMWERFSYYGMRALLTLYLLKHFLYGDAQAAGIYGAYTGLVYALPVLGGFFADRYLGSRRAVVYGGVLLCLGHLAMAYEGDPAERMADGAVVRDGLAELVLFFALSLIATGVGFLKANISTLVGSLYPGADNRRDAGFTLFYMGINIGAFAATMLVGYIGETWGWRYGFGLAGIGMVAGLTIFLLGQHLLGDAGDAPDLKLLRRPLPGLGISREYLIYIGGLLLVFVGWVLVQRDEGVGGLLLLTLVASFAYVAYDSLRQGTVEERGALIASMVLIFFSVTFWSLFEQAGTSMTTFADRLVHLHGLRASNLQAFNPGFIILLAPLFSAGWVWLNKRGLEPSLAVKFALGIIQAGLGFYMLVIGVAQAAEGEKVAMVWVMLAYLFHTTGELCLSPVGLSMVTRLSPGRIVGLMMGNWFLAAAFAGWLAGQLAKLAAIDTSVLASDDRTAMGATYVSLFENLALTGVLLGLVLLALSPLLKRLSSNRPPPAHVIASRGSGPEIQSRPGA